MVLLPGRKSCGGCGGGPLPYTLTLTPSGFEDDGYIQDTFGQPTPFESCFGSGGFAEWVARGGDYAFAISEPTQNVTIESVRIWNGGSGYAVKGRVEPTLSITTPTLTGADCTYEPVFNESHPECSACLKVWSISDITVSCGESPELPDPRPSGGVVPAEIKIAIGEEVEAATAEIEYEHALPTVTAAAAGGAGASLSVSLAVGESGFEVPSGWAVGSVSVESGGSGYIDGSSVTFQCGQMTLMAASASLSTVIEQPEMRVTVRSFSSGEGAVLAASTKLVSDDSPHRYYVDGVTVVVSGSGYEVGDEVRIMASNGSSDGAWAGYHQPVPYVSSVDESGGIMGIQFSENKECVFWRDTGVVESVSVAFGGRYSWPAPSAAVNISGGKFYAESDTAEPCVSTPWLKDQWENALAEGQILGVVSTENDCTFGKIVGATIENSSVSTAGPPSVPYGKACFNDPVSLVAEHTSPLVYLDVTADYGSGAYVAFGYGGPKCSTNAHLYQSHVAPTVTATASPGYNGFIEVTLGETTTPALETQTRATHPAWNVASITASGGCEYQDGDDIDFLIERSGGDVVVVTAPKATIQVDGAGTITGATITEPGEFYAKWPWSGAATPIELATIEDGGSGYAVYGREEPQGIAFSPSGPWTPTFGAHEDAFGRPWWSVDSIDVGAGSGFSDGQAISVVTAPPGDDGGTGWPYAADVVFSGKIRTQRVEPVLSASITYLSGEPPSFSVTVEPTDSTPDPTWRVKSVEVVDGGSGHLTVADTSVSFAFSGGHSGATLSPAQATAVVGPNGAITAVTLVSGGAYYGTNDVPEKIEIVEAGKLWKENKDIPALVSSVSISVRQMAPSAGGGAAFGDTVVDDDPYSDKFGQVVGISLSDQGSGYTPFMSQPGKCRWIGYCPDTTVRVIAPPLDGAGSGESRPTLLSEPGFMVSFVTPILTDVNTLFPQFYLSESMPADCASISFTASSPNADGTVAVGVGGEYLPESCTAGTGPSCQPGAYCLPDALRPLSVAGSVAVSLTIPSMEVPAGGVNPPMCVQQMAGPTNTVSLEFTATVELKTYCGVDGSIWLSGSAVMTPVENYDHEDITCTVSIGCADGELFATVAFTASCSQTWDDNGTLMGGGFGFTATESPVAYTVTEGFAVPDDFIISGTHGPTGANENEFPYSADFTFTNG